MGRKHLVKERLEDRERKAEWALTLTPMFLEKGIRQLSMDDVAAALGVSKATLYKYFRSREEILSLALELRLSHIRRYQVALSDRQLPYLDRFLGALQIMASELSVISTTFLTDLKESYPEVWKQVQRFIDDGLEVLRRFYEEGIERGDLAPIHPAVLVVTDELYFSRLAEPEFLREHQLSVGEALESYFLMKFGGMFQRSKLDVEEALRKWQNIRKGYTDSNNKTGSASAPQVRPTRSKL